jgi:hypothetical protein
LTLLYQQTCPQMFDITIQTFLIFTSLFHKSFSIFILIVQKYFSSPIRSSWYQTGATSNVKESFQSEKMFSNELHFHRRKHCVGYFCLGNVETLENNKTKKIFIFNHNFFCLPRSPPIKTSNWAFHSSFTLAAQKNEKNWKRKERKKKEMGFALLTHSPNARCYNNFLPKMLPKSSQIL